MMTGAHGTEVPNFLAAADVFVFPSLFEAMPRAVLEAMAMELPVVTSAVGGILEVIDDGVNGYLIRPGNVNDLVDKTFLLLNNENLRQRIGQKVRDTISQKFDFEKNIYDFAKLHYFV